MVARLILLAAGALLALPLAAASLPDPTALPASRSGAPAGASSEEAGLAWVRVDGPRSIAWYRGTTVKVGDPVVGGRVAAIREDHIVISGKDARRRVYLLDPAIRTEPREQRPPAR